MRSGLLVLVLLLGHARAEGPKPPCAGCTLDVYGDGRTAMPLLVVLHGDREQAGIAASRWRAAAKQRGWALLALQCPTSEQCKDSWWQWDGDPTWVRDQVAKVAETMSSERKLRTSERKLQMIDPARIYLAGWSGGATYIGRRAKAWHETFAAVVIHGGGQAPRDHSCSPRRLPAYFLVGDKNPLHELARDLRDYFTRCKQEVMWDLVAGGDHDKEHHALSFPKSLAVLDWLAAHTRTK